MDKEQACDQLLNELEKGEDSAKEQSWISAEEVEKQFFAETNQSTAQE